MRNESRFFTVFPSVVKAGAETKITITSIHEKFTLNDGRYAIKVVPKEKRDLPRAASLRLFKNDYSTVSVVAANNEITFSYFFGYEQEYRLILMNEDSVKMYDFSVYALHDDLYGTMPFRGDLHMHTTRSDGLGSIAQLVSAYREIGRDFICITDHHKHSPSTDAIKMFENVETGITVFPGEEVHNRLLGSIHIVNFGGQYSVNDILEEDYDNLFNKMKEEAKKTPELDEVDAVDFALRKWICNEIRKSGGKAIFPHPYWTICGEYHVETDFSLYMLKQGIYDIFEVFGGCTVNENQIQEAMWQELRAEGVDLPIVGSTDTHDYLKGKSLFGLYSTLVFAKDSQSIPDAIMNRYSVAVETIDGETPRVAGKFRLVKYAIYLLEQFYPVYETYTKDLGALMRRYAEAGDCKEAIAAVNAKAQDYKKRFFGYIS